MLCYAMPGSTTGSISWPTGAADEDVMLPNPGDYHFRDGGEAHYNSPQAMAALQVAARANSRQAYAAYVREAAAASRAVTIRGLLSFRDDVPAVPIDEVEAVSEIVKRFCTRRDRTAAALCRIGSLIGAS